MMSTRSSVIGLVAVFALAGCASSSESSGTNDNADTVTPIGNDNPGSFVLTAPPGFTDADAIAIGNGITGPAGASARSYACTLGQPVTNLPVGTYELGDGEQIVIKSNQTTTYALAGITIHLPTEPTVGINAQGDRAELGITVQGLGGNLTGAALHEGAKMLVGVAATSITWGYGDGILLPTLVGGQITPVDLTATTGRHVTRFHGPKSRDLPQPSGVASGWTVGNAQGTRFSVYEVAPEGTLVVGYLDGSAENATLTLPDGPANSMWPASGAPILDVQIGRLDVTDVQVTLSDGTTRTSKGTYAITGNLAPFQPSYSTGTWLDLWPGTYTLTTKYDTFEAGIKTVSQAVALAPTLSQ